jgi:hypothetical protein
VDRGFNKGNLGVGEFSVGTQECTGMEIQLASSSYMDSTSKVPCPWIQPIAGGKH